MSARPVGAGERFAYVNARLLDPATGLDAPGALLTDGGVIADMGPRLFHDGKPAGVTLIDCDGQCLAPGLVDIRVSLGEPGAEHKETFATGSQAAAAGGVTTMVCTPDTDPPVDDVSVLEFMTRRAHEGAVVNVRTMAAITKGMAGRQMSEMGMLAAAGAVGFTDGYRSIADAQVMRRALSYATTFGLLICHHTEVPELSTGVMNEGELATRLGLAGISVQAEAIMVERDMRLVELTGGRYHAAGISTGAAAEVIRAAKKRGLKVTCAVSAAHFALNENEVGNYRTFAKLTPPLRSEDDRKAIVEALRDGTIDIVTSAHTPEDPEAKRVPFAQAAPGAVGLETLLAACLQQAHNGRVALLDILRRVTVAPAELLGLPAGRLARGAAADLVLFDAGAPWKVDAEKFRSKAKNSPFDGHLMQGRVLRTVVGGRTVFAAGT